MKFLRLAVVLLLLREGKAFGATSPTPQRPGGQPIAAATTSTTTTTSRTEFLKRISEAAVASLLGIVCIAPQKSEAAATATFIATAKVDITVGGTIRSAGEEIMAQKEHGTSTGPVQSNLLYGADNKMADKICSFNRYFAELGGYYRSTTFEETVLNSKGPITFYDSVTGKALFVAPIHRSAEQFLAESRVHGWPSFRDDEVVWDNVRVLTNSGETVSVDGTHLGHNLPDKGGNRYCINLVSIAGTPIA